MATGIGAMNTLAGKVVRLVGRRALRVTRRVTSRVSAADVSAAVRQTIGGHVDCLLMHSSLSRCGNIENGPATVIDAVQACCDTLCLPTHTYCYPVSRQTPPPTYNARQTRSVVGEITNFFWQQPDVCRSIHPTHSLAARGPEAKNLCRGHELCNTPCGSGTPYERLVERDIAVLMFGVTMHNYTLFHTAEDAAHCPYLYEAEPYDLRALDLEGNLHRVRMYRMPHDTEADRERDISVRRRFKSMDVILEQAQLLRRQSLGHGELLFIPSARATHEFLLARLHEDPFFLVDRDFLRSTQRSWSATMPPTTSHRSLT
jgi:aminoglycoside 3-N-acetyltransferase